MSAAAVQQLADVLQAGPGPVGQLPGREDVAGIIWNVVLVTTGFNSLKNFYENYQQFRYAPPQYVENV